MNKKTIQSVFLGMVLLLMYLPILLLAVYSFMDSAIIGRSGSFTVKNYVYLFHSEDLRSMIFGTLILAVIVAVISTILGTLGAIGAFYSSKKLKRPIHLMNQIPVVNADVVTGFSICVLLIVFFKMDKASYIPLVIGLVSLCSPFVYLSVIPRLKQMDPQLYEAALDLGCSSFGALRKVVLPQLTSGIVSGFMMSITLTLDDYFITTYTKPSMFDTISTYVVNATKGAQTDVKTALWALSTIIFLIDDLCCDRYESIQAGRRMIMKYKVFSIIFSILLVITLPLALCSCSTQKSSKNDEIILRIANWEEYLDEGDWDDDEEIELENGKKIIGRNSMIKDFENWYEKTYHKKVKVEYSTFGTNEDMYNQLTIGDTYDLICPSEYMTMKLMAENKILKYSDEFWDTSDANNYYAKGVSPYIKKSLDQLKYQGQSVGDYTAGYMWGTLGYVYNPKYVSREDAEDWGLLIKSKIL